jgi:hypothetical protein
MLRAEQMPRGATGASNAIRAMPLSAEQQPMAYYAPLKFEPKVGRSLRANGIHTLKMESST